jgi:N-sulfoglucosamine sulfohydrolase
MNTIWPKFIGALLLIVLASNLCAAERPNFVVVLGDDVGWDAFGCTGIESARTPNIDKLSTQSLHMDRFYCSVSQCAPLRAELYTGLYPYHNGVLANAKSVSRPDVKNVADHLVPLGYRVGHTGKLHFGRGKIKFEKIEGFPSGANASKLDKYSLDGVRKFIQSSQAQKKPFCVFICSIHAHHPWDVGNADNFPRSSLKLRDHYIDTPDTRESVAKHAAEVEALDEQVGATAAMLKEMKLEKNTVFIFLSEQGIAMPRGKWSVYDHGSRALALVRWTGTVKPRKSQAIAMYNDIVPTMIDLAAGPDKAKDAKLDGSSMKNLWLAKTDKHRDYAFISNVHPYWQKAIVGPQYKLIWSPDQKSEHIWKNFLSKGKFFSRPWTQWNERAKTDPAAAKKLARVLHPRELELYRIDRDPDEVTDLARDSKYKDKVQTMFAQLKDVMKEVGEPLDPNANDSSGKKPPKTKKKRGLKKKDNNKA